MPTQKVPKRSLKSGVFDADGLTISSETEPESQA